MEVTGVGSPLLRFRRPGHNSNSAGSACTSGRRESSRVISALGVPPRVAQGTVRLSVGWGNTAKEIKAAADILVTVVEKIRVLKELEASVGGKKCY
mgnify:CR=1 FL=1